MVWVEADSQELIPVPCSRGQWKDADSEVTSSSLQLWVGFEAQPNRTPLPRALGGAKQCRRGLNGAGPCKRQLQRQPRAGASRTMPSTGPHGRAAGKRPNPAADHAQVMLPSRDAGSQPSYLASSKSGCGGHGLQAELRCQGLSAGLTYGCTHGTGFRGSPAWSKLPAAPALVTHLNTLPFTDKLIV